MVNTENCCGCSACVHTCPVKCIEMKEDKEGFLYPVINSKKCINCHKCEMVCPKENIKVPDVQTKTFVGYTKDEEIRKQSSSGGIFSSVAQWILKENGVVFGAAFDENFNVFHLAAENEEDLKKLRGSKYVQSDLGNSYPIAKKYLENNRKVLFTGTACQIAGLKNYLEKDYENLYTIDVLCHGVPSPKVWKMYLEDKKKQYNAPIEKIEFRGKDMGWKNFCMNIDFSNNQHYGVKFYEDKFMQMFLGNISLRPSCYNCHFKGIPRVSDMTIGDSWGIEKYMPDMDDDKGTSVILVHSENGSQMLDKIKEDLNIKEAILDKALPEGAESRRSVRMHPNRKKFYRGVEKGESFDTLCTYLKKNLIQRGISLMRYIARRFKL
ncbi:MAG: Coenzyme F420 hydrogenase/dehydrogenase, beta subunit C-terminal domain [Clostridia bacterium]